MRDCAALAFIVVMTLAGCASSRNAHSSLRSDGSIRYGNTTVDFHSSGSAGDTVRAGTTWKGERDAVKSQIALITLVIIVGVFILLALTGGTAGRGG